MTNTEILAQAEALANGWTNGNRSYVAAELSTYSQAEAIAIVAHMLSTFDAYEVCSFANWFTNKAAI